MGTLVYRSNNSGGAWWLDDADWDALAANGWNVHWCQNGGTPAAAYSEDADEVLTPLEKTHHRWLGAVAKSAAKTFASKRDGVREFERLARQCATDMGCPCCGNPHDFVWIDGGEVEYISPEPGPATIDLD